MSYEVTPNILLPLLTATLSAPIPDSPSTESQLSSLESYNGFLPSVFCLASSPDPYLSLAAAIYVKNLVRRKWQNLSPSASSTHQMLISSLPESNRAFLRTNIVPAMAAVHPKTRAQFAEALNCIIDMDFPLRFPELMPHIMTALHSSQPQDVEAGLIALRSLAKVYELKGKSLAARMFDTEEALASDPREEGAPVDIQFLHDHPRAALNFIVKETFPTLLHIMRGLAQTIDNETRGGVDVGQSTVWLSGDKPYELQCLICMIFWSCTEYDLPAILLNDLEGVFSDWMNSFLKAMLRPVKPPKYPECITQMTENDFTNMPEWKVKQWISQIVYRFFQRYSNPSCLNKNLLRFFPFELLSKFDDFFRSTFAAPFTQAFFEILGGDRRYMSPRVASLSLLYLEYAVVPDITYRVFKPRLAHLISNIIFPFLCITDSDLALWREDQIEYVRQTFEALEDFRTPRTAACSLLYLITKLRRSVVVKPVLTVLIQIMDRYANTRQRLARGERNDKRLQEEYRMLATQKDGALLAIGTIREMLVEGDPDAKYLRTLLSSRVIEEFNSNVSFLRARVCWLYGELTASTCVPFEVVFPGLEGIQKCLGDREFPVRVRAAMDIRHFMYNREAVQQIAPQLPDLLTLLFTVLDDIDNTEIVKTIDQVFVVYSDRIAPYALQLVERLVNTYLRASMAKQGDEEAGCTALPCIEAIGSIITSVAQSDLPEKLKLLARTEHIVSVVFERMFEKDRKEHFEQIVELLGMFVYHSATERGSHLRACVKAGVELQESVLRSMSNPNGQYAAELLQCSPEVRRAIQADVTAGAGVISPYLWSLFPRAMHAFNDWAAAYSFDYVRLIGSYVSNAPRVFLSGDIETSYVRLLIGMVSRLWGDSNLDSDDCAVQGSRICGLLLQHCRKINGRSIDREVGVLTELLVARLRANSKSEQVVNSLLTSLAHLTYVSPMTALAVIDKKMGCTEEVFTLWLSMVQQDHLELDYDRKTSAIALSTILGSDWSQLPVVLRQSIPQVLLAIVQLLESLAESSNSSRQGLNFDGEYTKEVEASQGMDMYSGFSSESDGDVDAAAGLPVADCGSGRNIVEDGMGSNGEMPIFSAPAEMEVGQDAEDDMTKDFLRYHDDVGEEDSDYDLCEDDEDSENHMFNILQNLDELLYFESVISRISPMALEQLQKALASDETQRIQYTLQRAAKLRDGDV